MRKLIMWNLMTLDGCFEGDTAWDQSFHELVWGEALEAFSVEQLKRAEMLVFGKATYLGMADYWTTVTDEAEIAGYMNSLPKLVCSTSLETASWNNTRILRDAVSEIRQLKTEGTGNLFLFGSGNLAAALMEAGLFDEYRLCLAPVLLGQGKRLFGQGVQQKLRLIESTPLSSGGLILRYVPA